jgi:hypothetical protein
MNVYYYGARRSNVEKKCPVCKRVYTTFDAKKKYCSDACAKQANKRR